MRNLIFILILLLSGQPTLYASGFSIGGFSIGGSSDSSDGGTSIDVNKIFDAIKHGKEAFSEVTEEEEQIIGKEAAAILLGTAPLLDAPKIQRYINQIGQWLAQQTERAEFTWHFAVLDTPSVNAFATSWGYIFITHGLLKMLNDEAELAGVLAHEIAHVIRRHHALAIKAKGKAELARDLASLAAGDVGGMAAEFLMGNIKEIYTKGLDKDDEFEADHIGVVIAARSGYDPYGLPSVLNSLDGLNGEDSDIALWYNTHPPALTRLTRLDELMEGRFDDYVEQPQNDDRFAKNISDLNK